MQANLVEAALSWMPPVTNLYRVEGGRHLAVLVVDVPAVASIAADNGLRVPVARSHLRSEVSVFYADERGQLVDADNNPLNGLTPYASTDPETEAVVSLDAAVTTHESALAALGHTLVETPEEN